MKILIRLALLSLLLLMGGLVIAQDGDASEDGQAEAPELIEFTDEAFALHGLRPAWRNVGNGTYARLQTMTDRTVFLAQSAPDVEMLSSALLPSLGMDTLPEAAGTLETDAYTWTLYEIVVETPNLSVAVSWALGEPTADDTNAALIVVQSAPDDQTALRETVLMPVLEALMPLDTSAIEQEMAELPYIAEEITFDNDDITIAGTLTLPEGDAPYPVAIIISGSGPTNRDGYFPQIAEIRVYRDIADYLTRNGIAVLRYDDRGTGESTGNYNLASSADLATDASAAVDYLAQRDDIDSDHITLIGHSEGSIIAPMVALMNDEVDYIISLAGSAVSGRDVLVEQNAAIERASGLDEAEVLRRQKLVAEGLDAIIAGDTDVAQERFMTLLQAQLDNTPEDELGTTYEQLAEQSVAQYQGPWMAYFLRHNPATNWRETTVPVLAIFGGLDVQVIAEQNQPALAAALEEAGNDDVTFITIDNLNHFLQAAEVGGLEEYSTLEQTVMPELLQTMVDWLQERIDG